MQRWSAEETGSQYFCRETATHLHSLPNSLSFRMNQNSYSNNIWWNQTSLKWRTFSSSSSYLSTTAVALLFTLFSLIVFMCADLVKFQKGHDPQTSHKQRHKQLLSELGLLYSRLCLCLLLSLPLCSVGRKRRKPHAQAVGMRLETERDR